MKRLVGDRYKTEYIRKNLIHIKSTEINSYYRKGYCTAQVTDMQTGKSIVFAFAFKVDNF